MTPEEKLMAAVHEYAQRLFGDGHDWPDKRSLLEAVHGYHLETRLSQLSAERRSIAALEAKAAVCDAYIEHADPNNTTGKQEIFGAREALRKLQESA